MNVERCNPAVKRRRQRLEIYSIIYTAFSSRVYWSTASWPPLGPRRNNRRPSHRALATQLHADPPWLRPSSTSRRCPSRLSCCVPIPSRRPAQKSTSSCDFSTLRYRDALPQTSRFEQCSLSILPNGGQRLNGQPSHRNASNGLSPALPIPKSGQPPS